MDNANRLKGNKTRLGQRSHRNVRSALVHRAGEGANLLVSVTCARAIKWDDVPLRRCLPGASADVFAGGSRLANTRLPGSPPTVITYHYEDARFPEALTGKSFNGNRYATFTYDDQRRATSTSHTGGVDLYQFSYQDAGIAYVPKPPRDWSPGGISYVYDPSSSGTTGCDKMATSSATTEINPLERRTTYSYTQGKKTAVSGDASPNRPMAASSVMRDGYGYEDVVRDFTGNVTDFNSDSHGHLRRKGARVLGGAMAKTAIRLACERAHQPGQLTMKFNFAVPA